MGLGGGTLTVNGMQAFHDCRQWVNYFLHTGHLHIEGLKMSKSLKNFITIDNALEKFTARQMRFAFLLQTWNARLDFKESVMQEVRSAESLLNVRLHYTTDNASLRIELMTCCASRTSSSSSRLATPRPKTWAATQMVDTTTRRPRRICLQGKSREKRSNTVAEKRSNTVADFCFDRLQDAQYAFRVALCDSFDTPTAIQILLDTVSATNAYLSRGRKNVNIGVILAVSEWVTRMLRMFGLGEGPATDARGQATIGWGQAAQGSADASFDVRFVALGLSDGRGYPC